jgi:uncharacterized protein
LVRTIRWEISDQPGDMVAMSVCEAIERGEIAPYATIRNRAVVAVAVGLLTLLVLTVGNGYGWDRGLLVVVGGLLGVSLYHASFGFTSAWRVFVFERRGAGVQAQLVMLALAVTIFFPLLGYGEIFGQPVRGFVAPVGWGVAFGALIFGIGMQLGGGCASGTLFTVGGGNTRMVLTLTAFVAGSLLATFHLPWWNQRPNLGAISLVHQMGWSIALVLHLAVFAILFALVGRLSTRETRTLTGSGTSIHWLRGPWPLLWGAVALALLNASTLLLAGRPWGITGAFSTWGGHAVHATGVDLSGFPYWVDHDFSQSLLSDVTTTMNVAIILGAMASAGLAGKFQPGWRVSWRGVLTAILGGLLMGYGGRVAFGCNIGAFFSGVASSSLHGWLWLACGFTGSILGTYVRKWLGDGPYANPAAACKPLSR